MKHHSRRTALKNLALTIPATWSAPMITSVALPAHASTTDATSTRGTGTPPGCTPDPNCDVNQVIDLNGTVHTEIEPRSIPLPAGKYSVTPVRGTYIAWTKWSDAPTGCDVSGENCFHGWLNSFSIITNEGTHDFGEASGSDDGFETQGQALAAATGGTFCISSAQNVQIHLRGEGLEGNRDDNSGGMSIRLQCAS